MTFRCILQLFLFQVCTGCSCSILDLHTEFIGKEQLASYYVHTPDPRLACPDIGQRLIIRWSLPLHLFAHPHLHLAVKIRFYNGEEQLLDYPISKRYGTHLLTVVNKQFECTGGISTYKAELLSNLTPLLSWHHQLWNETIHISIQE